MQMEMYAKDALMYSREFVVSDGDLRDLWFMLRENQ